MFRKHLRTRKELSNPITKFCKLIAILAIFRIGCHVTNNSGLKHG